MPGIVVKNASEAGGFGDKYPTMVLKEDLKGMGFTYDPRSQAWRRPEPDYEKAQDVVWEIMDLCNAWDLWWPEWYEDDISEARGDSNIWFYVEVTDMPFGYGWALEKND
jgi:hypothetical protein